MYSVCIVSCPSSFVTLRMIMMTRTTMMMNVVDENMHNKVDVVIVIEYLKVRRRKTNQMNNGMSEQYDSYIIIIN